MRKTFSASPSRSMSADCHAMSAVLHSIGEKTLMHGCSLELDPHGLI
jgi:hypothetical protein